MNDIKAAGALAKVLRNEDRAILKHKLDYLGSQIGMCALVFLAGITLYLLTLV